MLGWMLGCLFVYSGLFGTGSFLYGNTSLGLVWLALFLGSGAGLVYLVPRLWSRDTATSSYR